MASAVVDLHIWINCRSIVVRHLFAQAGYVAQPDFRCVESATLAAFRFSRCVHQVLYPGMLLIMIPCSTTAIVGIARTIAQNGLLLILFSYVTADH